MADRRLRLPKLPGRRGQGGPDEAASEAGSDRRGRSGQLRGRVQSAGAAAKERARARRTVVTGRRVRLVLMLVVLAVLVLVPGRCARNTIVDKQDDTDEVLSDVAFLQGQVEQSLSLEAERTKFERDFAAVQAAMPNLPELPELFEQMVELEQRTGVHLGELSPGQPAPVDAVGSAESAGVLQLALGLQVSGEAQSVLDFIDGLRDLPRLIVVDNVGLTWESTGSSPLATSESGSEADAARLDASITARMFMWAPETADLG